MGNNSNSHQDQLLKAKCLSVTTSSTTTVTRTPSSQGAECYKSRNVEDTNTKYKIQIHKMLKLGRYKRIMISVQSTRSPASLLVLSSFLCLATWPTYRSFEKLNPFQSYECLVMRARILCFFPGSKSWGRRNGGRGPCLHCLQVAIVNSPPGYRHFPWLLSSDAIASMPFSFFWAIIFFFMLITLGLDRLEDIHIGENIALQLVTDGVFENR